MQIAYQIARALIAVVRILGEARADDAIERRRATGWTRDTIGGSSLRIAPIRLARVCRG